MDLDDGELKATRKLNGLSKQLTIENSLKKLKYMADFTRDVYLRKDETEAIDNILNYIEKLENKLMYALSPTKHELALDTQKGFKEIIKRNIDEDTYTIKQILKKQWRDKENEY